jgi:hypothetical protein
MDADVRKIAAWAGQGTLRQFYIEVAAKTAKRGYEAEMMGDTVTCYRVSKQGGFLGLGGRQIKDPVLKIVGDESGICIADDCCDEEFVHELAGMLTHH